MGKGFAHAALNKDTADKVTWLADKAEFDTYFIIGLLLGIARYRTTSLWLALVALNQHPLPIIGP